MATDSKAKLLREAEKFVLQGRISHAIGEYLKIVKSDPEDVLTLNTIGDLYLRQGRVEEANRLFLQVAEAYTRNSFLLKAIAVYKKILASDPTHLEINSKIADLYARQGLSVDARIQYLYVADLYSKAGLTDESLLAFEKAVEMDHSNSEVQLKVQLKLGEIYLSKGMEEKAHQYFASAARAQSKAGNAEAAVATFQRALLLKPLDVEILSDYLESAEELGDVGPVLEHLHQCLVQAPEDVPLLDLAGRAHLAKGEFENSLERFKSAFAVDDSRYDNFLLASRALAEMGNYDRAAECLDPILPTLISRRETERAVQAYQFILQADSSNIFTVKKLADLYSATNDELRHLEALQKIAHHYASSDSPKEALEYIERILQFDPMNREYQALHRQAFSAAKPDTPYALPDAVIEAQARAKSIGSSPADGPMTRDVDSKERTNPKIVEIDLFLSYGMKEKALNLLREMEAQEPKNRDVRTRLIAVYRENGETRPAAEQCLLMTALFRKAGDEEGAQRYFQEAQELAPDWIDEEFDLTSFAKKHGISLDSAVSRTASTPGGGLEVDLSGDLSEIFFRDGPEGAADLEDDSDTVEVQETMADELHPELPPSLPDESVGDQLQEVDFYLRLGFQTEARTKLDEIAKQHPDHPELPSRYEQLGEQPVQPSGESTIPIPMGPELSEAEDEAEDGAQELHPVAEPPVELEQDVESTGQFTRSGASEEVPEPETEQPVASLGLADSLPESKELPNAEPEVIALPAKSAPVEETIEEGESDAPDFLNPESGEAGVNTMFSDLIDEVNALTEQEIAREDFETHFNLGIAYREMGLADDAINEFQSAMKTLDPSKSPRDAVRCCGMLSTCFLDKEMPRSAIRWCQTGLEVPDISPHESLALQYDMGYAYSLERDPEKALEYYRMIFEVDPSYRDVAQKIDHLKGEPDHNERYDRPPASGADD
jgi:tetratricopeptide (TPR) repeat protein